MVSGRSEGYSAVARGSDRKRIIRIGSALAFFRVYHDSISVPVKFPEPTPPAGFEGTRSSFEFKVWRGVNGRGGKATVPGTEEEDAVEYGAHILPIDWISAACGLNFGAVLREAAARPKIALCALQVLIANLRGSRT